MVKKFLFVFDCKLFSLLIADRLTLASCGHVGAAVAHGARHQPLMLPEPDLTDIRAKVLNTRVNVNYSFSQEALKTAALYTTTIQEHCYASVPS